MPETDQRANILRTFANRVVQCFSDACSGRASLGYILLGSWWRHCLQDCGCNFFARVPQAVFYLLLAKQRNDPTYARHARL